MHKTKGISNRSERTGLMGRVWQSLLLMACCLFFGARGGAQQPATPAPPAKVPAAQAPDNEASEQVQEPLPGDWAAELLDGILSAPNAEAADSLFRAAFAAGQSIIPQLAESLKD